LLLSLLLLLRGVQAWPGGEPFLIERKTRCGRRGLGRREGRGGSLKGGCLTI
jgi:hypothetical protein